ncbi:hypothetical protein PHYSODRAFT_311834 [Phytophthora sojae]|uniref:DDE-1 domain-containing protein n=1 Tax=Phytophthora sojae (strain P6497) TaxID=1094619 RepID=G4Z0H7_PHYSP|nr:hypothetical protein PHYSODRAFT_311834 [Phytophthora sojae]EGZ25263.1 hypothetical protein PHYSODRAFT_311834 [Phytophthora sojae]|eukprot:XP_009520551.1 hypothetical protein PHYSODRAFT_311834 [Phytophthora sojae]
MDETGFYYNQAPRGSLCLNEALAVKPDKSQITLALSKEPRWLKHKPRDVKYKSSNKAWMTTDINQTWLKDLDDTMRTQGRRILLLVDNASSHSDEGVNLTNVRVEKLPPNTTSQLQPLDQDIIYWVKRDVLSRKMDFALELVDDVTRVETGPAEESVCQK